MTIKETKSNWDCVIRMMGEEKPLTLGRNCSDQYHNDPSRMLERLSYYKFAAKMIGKGKRVLDIGCEDGLGSWVLAKECGFCEGIDSQNEAIERAKANFQDSISNFQCEGSFAASVEAFDAIVHFGLFKNSLSQNDSQFMEKIAESLTSHGIAIVGQESASKKLEKEMDRLFEFVFFFSGIEETVRAGVSLNANYFIAIGCKKRLNP